MPTQQLDFVFSGQAEAAAPALTDLKPLWRMAEAARLLPEDAPPEMLRSTCLELGLSKAGWRFVARHGQAAWAAIEDEYSDDIDRFQGMLYYVDLQVQAGLRAPVSAELGQRFVAANGRIADVDQAPPPRLLAIGERRLGRLQQPEERAHFISIEWVEVLAWFVDEPPKLDKNQWRAGWPAIRRQYHLWRKLNPEKLVWRSLLEPFTAGTSTVRPLTSSYDLAREGHEMRNCVAIYTNRCHRGEYRLFSVERAGQPAARVTVGLSVDDRGWAVQQVLRAGNHKADAEALRVAAVIANRYEMKAREVRHQRKVQEQMMLGRQRDLHRMALRERTLLPIEALDRFTESEVDFLERHLHWMERLADGRLQPISMAQVHFIAVARGLAEPNTEAERVWGRYVALNFR